MKTSILERLNAYFHIPPKARLEISKKNLKYCTVSIWCILAFGVALLSLELFVFHGPGTRNVVNIIYYSAFILIAAAYLTVLFFTRKKNSFFINQFLITLTCSFICLLMYFNVMDLDVGYIISFYLAIVIMIIAFELNPLFYTVVIILFFIELVYFGMEKADFFFSLYANNALFCLILIFFAFYKRHLISVRENNRLEIEQKNRLLSSQNIELSRQKDSLLMTKQFLEGEVLNQSQEIQLQKERIIRIQNNTITSLSSLVENRDEDTGDHVLRTRDYVQLIAVNAMLTGLFPELNEKTVNLYMKAAPMHDIGKIVVPDAVLKKPGRLSEEEFELIKLHTTKGGKIVEDVLGSGEDEEYVKIAKEIAIYHHERYDGTGYPYGLKGKDIPLSARVMSIADVFDALVSPRCYKESMPVKDAFGIIEEGAGTHFDPVLSRIFLEATDEVVAILNKYQTPPLSEA